MITAERWPDGVYNITSLPVPLFRQRFVSPIDHAAWQFRIDQMIAMQVRPPTSFVSVVGSAA